MGGRYLTWPEGYLPWTRWCFLAWGTPISWKVGTPPPPLCWLEGRYPTVSWRISAPSHKLEGRYPPQPIQGMYPCQPEQTHTCENITSWRTMYAGGNNSWNPTSCSPTLVDLLCTAVWNRSNLLGDTGPLRPCPHPPTSRNPLDK